jgi:hypothetical protein
VTIICLDFHLRMDGGSKFNDKVAAADTFHVEPANGTISHLYLLVDGLRHACQQT